MLNLVTEIQAIQGLPRRFYYQGETFKGHDMGPVAVLVTRVGTMKRPEWVAQFEWADGLTQVVKYGNIDLLADVINLFTTDDEV